MQKYSLTLLFIVVAALAFSQTMPENAMPLGWQSPSQPRLLLDDGKVIGSSNPLPVVISGGSAGTAETVTEVARQLVTVATASAQITSGLTADNRKFIEITTLDNTKSFWLDFGQAAVSGACRRVYGGIYLEIPKATAIHVYSDDEQSLFIVEGGY